MVSVAWISVTAKRGVKVVVVPFIVVKCNWNNTFGELWRKRQLQSENG